MCQSQSCFRLLHSKVIVMPRGIPFFIPINMLILSMLNYSGKHKRHIRFFSVIYRHCRGTGIQYTSWSRAIAHLSLGYLNNYWRPWPCQYKDRLSRCIDSHHKIRLLSDLLIFIMGISIFARWHLNTETAPWRRENQPWDCTISIIYRHSHVIFFQNIFSSRVMPHVSHGYLNNYRRPGPVPI